MPVVIYSLSAPMSRRRNKPLRLIIADSVDREPRQLHNLFERIFHECLLQKYLLAYKSLSRAYGPNRSYRKKRLAPVNDQPPVHGSVPWVGRYEVARRPELRRTLAR